MAFYKTRKLLFQNPSSGKLYHVSFEQQSDGSVIGYADYVGTNKVGSDPKFDNTSKKFVVIAAKSGDVFGTSAKTDSHLHQAPLFAQAGLTLEAGDLKIGDTDITGYFESVQELVDAVNAAAIAHITAELSSGELKLTNDGSDSVSVTGDEHDTLFGSGATTLADGSETATTATTTGAADAVAAGTTGAALSSQLA